MSVGFLCEIDFSGFPIFTDFDEDGGGESQERGLVGEEQRDAGAAADLFIQAFQHVGGAEPFALRGGQRQDREPFGRVGFQTSGEPRRPRQ